MFSVIASCSSSRTASTASFSFFAVARTLAASFAALALHGRCRSQQVAQLDVVNTGPSTCCPWCAGAAGAVLYVVMWRREGPALINAVAALECDRSHMSASAALKWDVSGNKTFFTNRALTLLGLQSHFGGEPLGFYVLCPRNGTAVLKRAERGPALEATALTWGHDYQ